MDWQKPRLGGGRCRSGRIAEGDGKNGAVRGRAGCAAARIRCKWLCVSKTLAGGRAARRVKAGWQAGRVIIEECGEIADGAASGGQQAISGIPPIGTLLVRQGMTESGAAALMTRDAWRHCQTASGAVPLRATKTTRSQENKLSRREVVIAQIVYLKRLRNLHHFLMMLYAIIT